MDFYAMMKLNDPVLEYFEHSYLLSSVTRRRFDSGQPATITTENLDLFLDGVSPPETPQDVLDLVLLHIADQCKPFFERITLTPDNDYPLARVRSAQDLADTLKFGEASQLLSLYVDTVALTPKGWDRINELRRAQARTSQAFVAMWFEASLDKVCKDGFEPALVDVGYRPKRIDHEAFNDKIDDEIVKEIRSSGLLVADFTGHRGGVYFEAGFALGLGTPLIWTCREDHMADSHFDSRQYNHIVWTEPADLKEKLVNRIEATLPDRFE